MSAASDTPGRQDVSGRLGGLLQVLALALAPLVALGFSRFSYALLLPAMQSDLGWSLSQAGALNTANGLGYLIGAGASAWAGRRWGESKAFGAGMLVSAMALLLSGLVDDWHTFMAVRFLGGISTAVTFVLGTSLATRAMPQRPATALAFYFGGSGMGMVLAGSVLPHWVDASAQGWQTAWLLMGIASLLAAFVSAAAAKSLPKAKSPSLLEQGKGSLKALWPSLTANALFGAGYVGYTTFVIALLRQQGYSATTSSLFFCGLGLASLLATPAWGKGLARLRNGHGFAVVCVCVAVGSVPVILSPLLPSLAFSALVFGASFMAGPAAVSLVAQRLLPYQQLAGGLGALTAAFSLGQSIGPLLAGWIADTSGHLEAGLWLGPALLACAAAVSLVQSGALQTAKVYPGEGTSSP
ncbi:YbfB/YjiJ family MFS transporter [Hydrogenophaga aquatica]